ncbi:MAG TPA: hypothetical protein VGT44_01845 [Ktedonobacteraceae bacterium]|nr:hypothetical protein [Ktedonobacteraceae bacterium]
MTTTMKKAVTDRVDPNEPPTPVQTPAFLKSLTVIGNLETDLEPLLSGYLSANIHDEVEPYSRYVSIIDANEYWYVTARWALNGTVRKMICGNWCVRLFMESLGEDKLDLELSNDEGLIPLDPCGNGQYEAHFTVKPGTVRTEHCGTPFQPVLSVTYLTSCKVRFRSDAEEAATPEYKRFQAGPIAGIARFPITQFIMEEIEA